MQAKSDAAQKKKKLAIFGLIFLAIIVAFVVIFATRPKKEDDGPKP